MLIKTSQQPARNPSAIRIGAVIGPHDPYWVQVREATYEKIEQLGASLVPLEISDSNESLYNMDPASLAEELLSQELDAIVSQTLPISTIYQLVYNGLPVVHLGESQLRHRLFCSPSGLYEAAKIAGKYVGERLQGHGRVLCVGGLLDYGEDKGVSRISGFRDGLQNCPDISVLHCPSQWRYDKAYPQALSALRDMNPPVDAIYGISDSLALAGRDAAQALGVLSPRTVVVGINGDPQALAAIVNGSFSATVETSSEDLGKTAVELAFRAAQGKPLPAHYTYKMSLVTAENATEHVVRKLAAIANLPNRLVGVNREEERHRFVQLQTSAAINQRVGMLLDRNRLSREITELIRDNYGFDLVQLFTWSESENRLFLEGQDKPGVPPEEQGIALEDAGLLGEAIRRNESIFIPDLRYSSRFPPDPRWPDTRSRVIAPIRLGGRITGLLDLQSSKPVLNLRWEITGLQMLADQLGIALRNAELYSEAVQAREIAERADQLKTRLLANVSHELRTPLNVILGYSQSALENPNLYGEELPESLRRDLRYIYQSGEHLIRIINDLLDLSRAEIGELNLFPEPVDAHPFLQEVFASITKTLSADCQDVCWELQIPERLPIIQADQVRLRQILINLLSNAAKFTSVGRIVLGAEVEPPFLHLWVADSGPGIPIDQQERIFEPFVTSAYSARRKEGIGLGLTITRRLVALHGGSMSLESQPDKGSTFHVYLPLPNLNGSRLSGIERQMLGDRAALVVIGSLEDQIPREVLAIASRNGWEVRSLVSGDGLEILLQEIVPAALAWDLSHAAAADWNLIHRVQAYPQLLNTPLIIYGHAEGSSEWTSGITNVMLKPLSDRRLIDIIDSISPASQSNPVLIVDDDAQARTYYQSLIDQALPGQAVRVAEDGIHALSILKEEAPSLVILDLIMPQIDGFQVLEAIRSDERTCKVPVIVLSGKQLTFEDARKLNFSGVTFHSKGVLSAEEIIQSMQQASEGKGKLSQPTSLLVKQALAYLHQNITQPISRSELAEAVGVSETYLSQIFRLELNLSPLECLNRLRIQKARELLRLSNDSVTEIASLVGFDDPAYFSRVFRKLTGCSPNAYRQGKS